MNYAIFKDCLSLTNVTFGAKVTQVPTNIFENDTGLEAIDLPENILTIGGSAFKNSGLTSIKLPQTLTTIGASAFEGSKLKSIVIPASVVTLNGSTLKNCTELTSVVFECDFDNMTTKTTTSYFEGCTNLTYVKLPANISTLSGGAFKNCPNLKVWIPSSMGTGSDLVANLFEGTSSNAIICFEAETGYEVANACGVQFMKNLYAAGASIRYGVTEAAFDAEFAPKA